MSSESDSRARLLERAIRLKRTGAAPPRAAFPARPADAEPRLGELQRSLWLVHRMDPLSAAYNLVSAFRLRGALEIPRLERALALVVARHRILRSTFRDEGGTVVQLVHPPSPLPVEVVAAPAGGARAAAVEAARQPFDLEAGPLVRVRLVEEADGERRGGERLLLLVLHHVLADERSLELLLGELAAAYTGRLSAEPPALQVDDWVHWRRGHDPETRRAELDRWRRRLDPLPEELRLPFARPPSGAAPAAASAPGRLLARSAPPGAQAALRRLAADTGTTPFAALAFAFRLLLERYTGGARVAFGTPVSARSHPATARMIGYFTNPVVVAAAVDEDESVARAVRTFGGELRDDLAHATVPFAELAEELAPPRRAGRHPLFQAMLVHRRAAPALELGEARLEPLELDTGSAKFDLTLFATEGDGSLDLAVEYRSDRFDEAWMRRLLDHWANLLEHLPADPDRPTAQVPMLGAGERRRLAGWSRGPAPRSAPAELLPRQIHRRVHRAPDAEAVACGGVRRTYGQLDASARAIAGRLAAAGVRRGDRVGLFLPRSPALIAAILGVHRAGAAYVPVDPAGPTARNRAVLADAEVAAVLTAAEVRDRLPSGPWPGLEVEAPGAGPGEESAGAGSAPERSGPELSGRELSRRGEPPPDPAPGDAAYLLYTSGSTGLPKGVVVSHDNLRASTGARLDVYERPPGRFLLVPGVTFDSSVAGIFWTLATGGTLVLPTDEEARDARRLAELVGEERVGTLLCVPSLWARMLAAGGAAMGGLESAVVAGEACPPGLVEEHFRTLPGVRLYNEYGPTEGTVWASVHAVEAQDAAGPVPIGRPIPGVALEVLDGRGRPVPAGVPGEGWIAGPTVAQGYWRRPELTAERFPEARRYRSGDRLAWSLEGRLLFHGRVDEQVKLRGLRIEPGEVEAVLRALPGVGEAAVVARGGAAGEGEAGGAGAAGRGGEVRRRLVAFVEPQPGAPAGSTPAASSPTAWRRPLAERLPAAMVPARLVELAALPRLPSGKLDRRRLRRLELAPEGAPVPAGEAGKGVLSETEQGLVSLWEGLLGRTGVGPADNFFDLGGHSLLVVEMTVAIERDFAVRLSAADVFAAPTVREVAGLVERRLARRGAARAAPYRHLFPIQPLGRGAPLVVAVPHFFTAMLAERFRGERPVYGLRGVSLRPGGNRGRWRTMRALGRELVDEVRRRFPEAARPGGGVVMAGYSFGATMAIEAVRQMEERGIPVHRLLLVAPMAADVYRLGPLRFRLHALRQPATELSAGEALGRWLASHHPFGRRFWRLARRRLAVEPWRRLLCALGRVRRWVGLPLTERILWADVRVERFRLHAGYRPGVVRTPTVIFNAREPETDAAATWRPWFRGSFEVVEIPDPHCGEEAVAAAERVILRHLDALEVR